MKRHTVSVVICIVAVAVAWSANLNGQRIVGPIPASLQNLATVQTVEIRSSADTVVLRGAFVTSSESSDEVERTAVLSGSPGSTDRAEGKADIELERSGAAVTNQELEVGLKRLKPEAEFTLYVDGARVVTFTINRKGDADLKFTSKHASSAR